MRLSIEIMLRGNNHVFTDTIVHPTEPDTLPPDRRAQVEGRASQARMSLSRTGWEVVVLPPSRRLRDVWHVERTQPLVTSGS